MKVRITRKFAGFIQDLNDRNDLVLVDLDHDVEHIKQGFGNRITVRNMTGFFVRVENGDYAEVYGYEGGPVPYIHKVIYKIEEKWY